MLNDRIIKSAFSSLEAPIEIQTSRCVRMRFNKNACSHCTENCRTGALSIDGGIAIDAGKCTNCMVCAAECPSDSFSAAGMDFSVLLSRLKKIGNTISNPVLGCKKTAEAHEKGCCMGFLSEEHIIALARFLEKPLYLNLTGCAGCENSFIVEKVRERVKKADIKSSSFAVEARIVLIESNKDFVFEDISYDRRAFFKAFKNMTFRQVSGLIDEKKTEIIKSYSAKKIPLKRNLLNTVVSKSPDNSAAGILENYAFTVKAGPSCNNCFSCIGMCPTGALKIKKDEEGTGLLFNSSLCNGCSLCRDFCRMEAVSVFKGSGRSGYFDYRICNPETYASLIAAADRASGTGVGEAAYQGR